jgi:hypothetical protein
MFADPRHPEDDRPQQSSAWVAHAGHLPRATAVLAGLGSILLALSLFSPQVAIAARALAVGALGLAAIAALLDLWWRGRRRRSGL